MTASADSMGHWETNFWLTQAPYIAADEPHRRSQYASRATLSSDASRWYLTVECEGGAAPVTNTVRPIGDPDLWETEYVQLQMPGGREGGCLHLTVTRGGQAISERHDKLPDPIAGWHGSACEIAGGWRVVIAMPRASVASPWQFRLVRWAPGEGMTRWPTPFGSWWHVMHCDFATVHDDSCDAEFLAIDAYPARREAAQQAEVTCLDDDTENLLEQLRIRVAHEPCVAFGPAALPDLERCRGLLTNRIYFGDGVIDLGPVPDWNSDHGDYYTMVHATRFDFLADLVAAYRHTGEAAFAQGAIALIESWIAGCELRQFLTPRRYMMRVGTGIIVSHRLVCMLRTVFSLVDTPYVNAPLVHALYRLVAEASYALDTTVPRLYNKNHAIIIGNHLVQLSILCRELPAAATMRETYWGHLRRALEEQFLPDDIQAELSTCYHMICYARLTEATDLCEQGAEPVPDDITQWRRRILAGAAKYLFPNGQVAAFNDGSMDAASDVIDGPARGFRDIILHDGLALGLDEGVAIAGNGVSGHMAAPFSHALPYAGHYILRDGLGADAMALAFDAGPLGIAHQHEDALSVMLVRYGQPLLIDIGSGAYDPALPMRQYSMSTESHSSICIDGYGQAARLSPMHWKRTTPWAGHHHFGDTLQFAHGVYDHGYGADAALRVRHERAVLFVNGEYVVLVDYLMGEGTHHIESHFALAPLPYRLTNGGVETTSGAGDIRVQLLHPFASVQMAEGQLEPFAGWAPDGGHGIRPSPRLTFSLDAVLPCRLVTLLAPFRDPADVPSAACHEANGDLTVQLTRHGHTATLQCDPHSLDIRFAHPQATLQVTRDNSGSLTFTNY